MRGKLVEVRVVTHLYIIQNAPTAAYRKVINSIPYQMDWSPSIYRFSLAKFNGQTKARIVVGVLLNIFSQIPSLCYLYAHYVIFMFLYHSM